MSRLVVKKHRPLEIVLAVVLFSSAIAVLVWVLLDANHWRYISNQLSWNEESRLLWNVNQEMENENKELRERVIMLERSTQIDKQTAQDLQNQIRDLQSRLYLLKGELEFYQGIMSSTTGSKGLNAQGLHIIPTDQERFYRFKLVLTNVAKSDKVVEVTMDMSVEGMNKAGSVVLSLDQIIAGSELKRTIQFKNFERIEGSLNFPEGFTPLRVVVDLQQKGIKSTVQRVFEWPGNAG